MLHLSRPSCEGGQLQQPRAVTAHRQSQFQQPPVGSALWPSAQGLPPQGVSKALRNGGREQQLQHQDSDYRGVPEEGHRRRWAFYFLVVSRDFSLLLVVLTLLSPPSCPTSDKFHGDLYLTVKLLLPGVVKSVYNLNDKQIVKLFSRIFRSNQEDMVRDLEQVCCPPALFDKSGHISHIGESDSCLKPL